MEEERFPFIVGGERGGKSFTAEGIAFPHAFLLPMVLPERFFDDHHRIKFRPNDRSTKPRTPDISLFGPTYDEPRIEFEYMVAHLQKLGEIPPGWKHISRPSDGSYEMVTKSGVLIDTRSMKDPGTIRAIDLHLAMICEAGRCPYEGVERVHGRVSAKRGPIIYSGTLEESQQWYRDWALMGRRPNFAGIKAYSLPTWSNLHEFPGGREDPEIIRLFNLYGEELFAMRNGGEARPPRHRVLREFKPEHVKAYSIEDIMKDHPDAKWEFCCDPGYASAYAVLIVAWWYEEGEVYDPYKAEMVPGKVKKFHVFDEIYEQQHPTPEIIKMLQAKETWPLIRERKRAVFDIASKGHRDGNSSSLEIWQATLPGFSWNMKYWFEDRLIERLRISALQNHFTISPFCKGLLAEAGLGEPVFDDMHPWKYGTNSAGAIISEKPLDKWNHSAKAFGYFLLDHLGQVERQVKSRSRNRLVNNPARRKYGAPSSR
jgi:hypothetical protein